MIARSRNPFKTTDDLQQLLLVVSIQNGFKASPYDRAEYLSEGVRSLSGTDGSLRLRGAEFTSDSSLFPHGYVAPK